LYNKYVTQQISEKMLVYILNVLIFLYILYRNNLINFIVHLFLLKQKITRVTFLLHR